MGKRKAKKVKAQSELVVFLKNYRQQNSLKLNGLAKLSGLKKAEMEDVIKGKSPRVNTLQTLADALGYDAVEMFKMATTISQPVEVAPATAVENGYAK